MTVVVQPTHTPATEEVSERERRARVLEAAALEIEVHGWAKGQFEDAHGAMCLVGAVHHADDCRDARPFARADYIWWGDWLIHPEVELFAFNDTIATSAAEVTFLLRWRAEEVRAGL
jgi:hypothetical protein